MNAWRGVVGIVSLLPANNARRRLLPPQHCTAVVPSLRVVGANSSVGRINKIPSQNIILLNLWNVKSITKIKI